MVSVKLKLWIRFTKFNIAEGQISFISFMSCDLLFYWLYDLCTEWLVPTAIEQEPEFVDLKQIT